MIPKRYLMLLMIGGCVIALDQAVKIFVHTHFSLGEALEIIPGFFDLEYTRNPGAAFGMLGRSNETFRTLFFLTMPVIASVIILYVLRGLDDKDTLQITALSLIFGGAIGNYIDRLSLGSVVDFLKFHYRNIYIWPNFNVADTAIVCGVGVLILLLLLEWKDQKKQQPVATGKAATKS